MLSHENHAPNISTLPHCVLGNFLNTSFEAWTKVLASE